GGQFNVAKRVPGKEEFHETLRYFRNKLESTGVELHLNRRVDVDDLVAGGYDEIVLATGIVPRTPAIPGIEHPKVISYLDAILERKPVGGKVAVIGAGGIGFDVSEFITHAGPSTSLEREAFWKEWGIDTRLEARGGIAGVKAEVHPAARQVFLLQRKKSKVGDGLGKTTGWIHRAGLKNKQVQMVNAVEYLGIDDAGLHIRVAEGEPQVLPVDTVIVCAGQDPLRELQDGLLAAGQSVHLIGGADVAAELDAKRAINQGSRLAAEL
ncbi:FAD-dependent oxidoreductase, partial [Pseudomonas aeruginosa]